MRRALALLPLLAACIAEPTPARAPHETPPDWTYVVTVDEGVETLHVEMTFRTGVPAKLVLGDDDGVVADRTTGSNRVTYSVPVDRCVQRAGRKAVRTGGDVMLSPGLWLLRPAIRDADVDVRLELLLPPGVNAAVPWTELSRETRAAGGSRRVFDLPPSTFEWEGACVLGRAQTRRVEAAGAVFDVTLLDAACLVTSEGLDAWIRTAADAAALPYGEFPVPRLQVLVRPVGRGRRPIVFGQALRGGGPAVRVLLAANATDASLPGEWVAVHEMLHLGLPRIAEPWMSEGLTTYYQEIARARAGCIDAETAWRRIHDGFERGGLGRARSALTLRQESDAMHQRRAYLRVYWGGAAIALLWDLELRRGGSSLDAALQEIRRRHGGRMDAISAATLVAELDAWHGTGALRRIADAALGATRFPDIEAAYAALGLDRMSGRPRAPSALRDAIVAP